MSTSSRRTQDRELDKAIEQTFPASDPTATGSTTSTERPGSDPTRKAPVITKKQIEAAAAETEDCSQCNGTGKASERECHHCGGIGRVAVSDDVIGR